MQKIQNKDDIHKVVVMNVSESGRNYLYDYLLKNHPNEEYKFINYDNKIDFDYYNNRLLEGINFIRIERKKRIDQLNILIRLKIVNKYKQNTLLHTNKMIINYLPFHI
jgi:hypothetical protein